MNREEWEDIERFEGLYKINAKGDILSLPKNGFKGGLLRQYSDRYGYKKVTLYKNNKPNYFTVHRLEAKTFLKNRENKAQVNHINNDRSDNRASNLEWCSMKETLMHSHKQGRQRLNATAIMAIDNEKSSRYIFNSQREAEKELRIPQYVISRCVRGKRILRDWRFEYAGDMWK
jgi:hypothetical protein